ncbi:MAG: hypothetical protein HDS89_05855, partial [Bacteroidales bacterium]|nr:hypothetical protein [Bacteroidales bacterium]
GASRAFALNLYKNTLETTVGDDGTLTIGIKCDRANNDCWCCFDNFRLLYHGVNPAGVEAISTDDNAEPVYYYDLTGCRIATPLPGNLYIRKQGSRTSKILF